MAGKSLSNLCKSLSHFPGFMLCQSGIAWVGNDNCPECPIVVSQSYRIEDRAGYKTYLAARKYGCSLVNVRMLGDGEVTPTPIERIDPSRWARLTYCPCGAMFKEGRCEECPHRVDDVDCLCDLCTSRTGNSASNQPPPTL